MDIWDVDKLLLFLAFVVPGFISIKTFELLFPGVQQDSSKQLVDAITYSSLNYALLIWPITAVETSDWKTFHPNLYALFYMLVLFASPVTLSLAWWKLRTSSWFRNMVAHPTKKPWDYVFAQRQPYWIKVVLKDGTKLSWVESTPEIPLLLAHQQMNRFSLRNRGSLTIRADLSGRKTTRLGSW